jgi:hypothetical protein
VPEDHLDDWIARRRADLWPHPFEPAVIEPAVRYLAELAGGGRLRVGDRGRAPRLPLSRSGVSVAGIELSVAMIDQLRTEPDSATVDVTIGDLSTTYVDGTFGVVHPFQRLGPTTIHRNKRQPRGAQRPRGIAQQPERPRIDTTAPRRAACVSALARHAVQRGPNVGALDSLKTTDRVERRRRGDSVDARASPGHTV